MLRRTMTLGLGMGLCLSLLLVSCAGKEPTPECKFNSDCANKAQSCNGGKCVDIKCSTDNDCRGGWFCNTATSKCVEQSPVECRSDQDCTNQQTCDNDKCVAKPECSTDSDCTAAAKPTCTNGTCVEKSCTDDGDCTAAQVCKDSKCVAKPVECEKDGDCTDAVKTACKDGTCVEPTCRSNSDCQDPARPLCVSQKCIADDGKAEGEACETGKSKCKVNLICAKDDPQKTTGICRTACNPFRPTCPDNKVCQQLDGANGICLDKNNGKAEGEECDDQTPCERDLVCKEWKGKKICAKPCDPTLQACGSREECYTFKGKVDRSYCVSRREPCGVGRPCEHNYLCESGFCNPPPSCEGITCKGDFEVCDKGVCREKRCPDDLSCPTNSICTAAGTCEYSKADPGCVPCSQSNPCGGGATCLSGFGGSGSSQSHCFESCTLGQPCSNANFTCRAISVTLTGVPCSSPSDCTKRDPRFNQCNNGQCGATFNLCVPTIGSCTNKCQNVNCQNRDVCVPADGSCVTPYKKLCEPCKHAEECGGANDLCITFTQGTIRTSYCGGDCSKDPCPQGYECATLQNGGKQCVPTSRKCPP